LRLSFHEKKNRTIEQGKGKKEISKRKNELLLFLTGGKKRGRSAKMKEGGILPLGEKGKEVECILPRLKKKVLFRHHQKRKVQWLGR